MKHDLTLPVTGPETLADVIDHLNARTDLDPRDRRELVSAVNAVAKFTHCPPLGVPVVIPDLSKLLAGVQPRHFRISARRLTNVRSLFVRALILAGVDVEPLRLEGTRTAAWTALLGTVTLPVDRNALQRFSVWCSLRGIEPEDVDDEVLATFRHALVTKSFHQRAEKLAQSLVRSWNRTVGSNQVSSVSPLSVTLRREIFLMPASTFPVSFQKDRDAWGDRLGGSDLLEEHASKPLRPVTVKWHRDNLLRCASALVQQGVAAAAIVDLSVLVETENAKLILRWFLARTKDGKPSKQTHDMSAALMALARHWVRLPEAQLQKLGAICSKCRIKSVGMTKKNRDTLRLFENEILVRDLMTLPDRLMRRALSGPTVSKLDAYLAEQALAIAILTNAPIRIENLANIHLDKSIIRSGKGHKEVVSLYFPAHAVKNDLEIELELAEPTVHLLDTYLKRAWPVLAQPGSRALFPGANGVARSKVGLGMAISRTTLRELGVRISPHQFRHITGYLFLKLCPGDYETVRVLLGHKSLQTTIQFYAGMEIKAAAKRYDEVVLAPHRGRRGTPK